MMGKEPASQAVRGHGELRNYVFFDMADVKSLREDSQEINKQPLGNAALGALFA